jgi:hypothetical protein
MTALAIAMYPRGPPGWGRRQGTDGNGSSTPKTSFPYSRTSEGRERAKRAGVRMGRKPKLSAHQVAEIRERKAGGESVRYLARSYGVSPNTISRVR